MATVLISIPKNTRHVEGLSRLCSAMGTPRLAHTRSSTDMAQLPSSEAWGVTKMKSSR